MKVKSLLISSMLFAGIWGAGQDYQSYYEEFDVVLYQLQVNVRDSNGNHIPGLTKEDFELKIKGQIQRLETVEEISVDSWLEDDSISIESMPEQARRLFVFLFDMRYTTKKGVLAAQKAAREFVLDEMLPSDLVSIFTYNPLSGVTMITDYFTNDQGPLLDAIDTLGLRAAKNMVQGPAGYFMGGQLDSYIDELNGLVAGASDANSPTDAGSLGREQLALEHLIEITTMNKRAENAIYQREVVGFLNSMEKFADGLRLIRGRKNVVWFSAGFDATGLIGETNDQLMRNNELIATGETYRVPTDQYGRTNIQHDAKEAIEHLQASGAVLFAVDTSLHDDKGTQRDGLQTLNMFAVDTGGRVYQNYNNLREPLSEIKEVTNDYYLLSFYPETDLKKGKIGKIKIKVNTPGADIYTSKGIMVEPDFKKLTKLEKQIHLSEYLGRDQVLRAIPIDVSILQIPHSDKLVKLSVGVDMRGDYFLGKTPREFEIHSLALVEETDQLFDRTYFKFQFDPKKVEDVLSETGLKYFGNLFVKPGTYKLKVVVRDLDNGKVGSSIRKVAVTDDHLSVTEPMLITDKTWLMMRQEDEKERLAKAGNLDFSYPFRINGNNLTPQNQNQVRNKESEVFFFLLSDRNNSSETIPQVRAVIQDKNGKIIPIPKGALAAQAEFQGGQRNLIAFALKVDFESLDLASGENYKLMAQFNLKEGAPLRAEKDIYIE